MAALRLEPAGQLARSRGLTGALEAGHEDDGRGPAGVGDLQRLAAEHGGEFGVDDLDDLLRRVERLGEVGADGLCANAGEDVADDRDVDVGLEEGRADLAEDLVDVGFRQAALAAETFEDAVETVGKAVEHAVYQATGTAAPTWGAGSVDRLGSRVDDGGLHHRRDGGVGGCTGRTVGSRRAGRPR